MWMMLPPPALIIAGRIARLIRNAPATLTPNTVFQSASVSSSTDAVRIVSGRAVHQNVDGGIFGEDRFGGRLDLRLVAHVAGNRDRRLPDRRGRCLCRRSVQIDAGDVCAGLGESERNRAADAVAGAGDDGGFARERIFAGERHDTAAAAMRPR